MGSLPIVPNPSDQDVQEWLRLHQMRGAPELVAYQDFGYKERFCHVSAKHHAIKHGGKRVHGWALWRWAIPSGTIIFGEHHSVWETAQGTLIDVTPPASSGPSILFVRDDASQIVLQNGLFLMHTDRSDWPEIPRVLKGEPTELTHYPLDAGKPDLVAYCRSIGFDIPRMATDPDLG